MERVLDLRVSAALPLLAGQLSLADDAVMALRQRTTTVVQQLLERARAEGTLRPDAAFADIALMLIRLGRPHGEHRDAVGYSVKRFCSEAPSSLVSGRPGGSERLPRGWSVVAPFPIWSRAIHAGREDSAA